MDIKKIKVGGSTWNMKPPLEYKENQKLEEYFYSWGEFSVPTQYFNCDGNNLAIRKCLFDNQTFIECDFDKIDASDSTFVNCLFLNCTFRNANLHKAIFIGSCIMNQGNISDTLNNSLVGAGMSQSKFKSSNTNKSVLSNLNLSGCGFRYSVLDNTVISKVSIEYTSFEDAYFNQCIIDKLDLRKSACRGVIINNCKIKKYVSSVEKTLGAIGALQILESCNNIELSYLESEILTEEQLVSKLKESSSNFLNEGKLFEFFNIMLYILKKTDEIATIDQTDSKSQLSILNKDKPDGFPVSKLGMQLYELSNHAYESIVKSGKNINLDDILYLLKLMFFLEIHEYILIRFLGEIFNSEIKQRDNDYSDFLIISQIRQYFQAIGEKITGNKYTLEFHNSNATWNSKKDRNEFFEFCEKFIREGIGAKDYSLVSMHEGSIDAIFESLFNIENILIAAAILGCEFDISNNNVSIHFSGKEGVKTYAKFLKELASVIPFFGDKKPTREAFRNGLERVQKITRDIMQYLKRNDIKGYIKKNTASKIIEETIKTTTYLQEGKNKIRIEKSEIKRKIIENH